MLFAHEYRAPWLIARFAARQRMMSWSLNRPGSVEGDTVAWLQVSDADLPVELDPRDLLERRLAEQGLAGAVGLMTARDLRHHHVGSSGEDGVFAQTLLTLGLSNAVRLDGTGRPLGVRLSAPVGTINILVAVSTPLGDGAMVEAVSVATVARTAALLSATGRVIGTGTDCIVIACPNAPSRAAHAGLHTGVGKHIAASVYAATLLGCGEWLAEFSPELLELRDERIEDVDDVRPRP